MDPEATLACLLQAILEREPEAIREYAETLAHWYEKGGFTPTLIVELFTLKQNQSADHVERFKAWRDGLATRGETQ